jgi:hypothetical protein
MSAMLVDLFGTILIAVRPAAYYTAATPMKEDAAVCRRLA